MSRASLMRDSRSHGEPDLTTIRYIGLNRSRFVTKLKDFVQFPSVSAQATYSNEIRQCADLLANYLQRIGLKQVDIFAMPRHVIVYAESIEQSALQLSHTARGLVLHRYTCVQGYHPRGHYAATGLGYSNLWF